MSCNRFAWLAIMVVTSGCGIPSSATFDRVAIEGTVTLDNQPLANASIQFIPDASVEGPKVILPVRDGVFAVDEKNGPVAGLHRVEIVLTDEGEPAHDDEQAWQQMKVTRATRKRIIPLPAIYHERSILNAMIEPADTEGRQSLVFDLKSR